VDAGSVDGGSAGAGKKCTGGDMFACNTFVTIEGKEIPLGPYGATMEANVGMGFENPVNLLDDDGLCAAFAELGFMQDAMASAKLVDSSMIKLALYSVYRPANFVAGEKYPLITWGNGTCAQPEGYGALLRYVASHGFIVVAPNSRYIGDGTAQRKGIDFMTKLNSDMMSPYYQKVDLERVGAMGHSQGSGATTTASSDARIKSVILFNGGGAAASKPFLAVSGDTDIGNPTLASYKQTVSGTTQPAAYLFYHKVPMVGTNAGHLTLMTEPQRVTEATVAWFKYTLSKDEASKAFFIGTDCKLCNHTADYDYGHNDKL
jgi:dienelactone hydrolase